MVFNSPAFLLFFAVVLAIHYLPLPWRVKKYNLVLASYLFYAAWNPPLIILLWISTIVDYWIGRFVAREQRPGRRRLYLILSLAANLGFLSFFKYGAFLVENFLGVSRWLGASFTMPVPDILLPIGISFYTFQTMSYVIDVYRREFEPCRNLLDFALYISFFPHLVAGPIMRASDLLTQFATPRKATFPQFVWGLSLLVFGLFQKMVLADGFFLPMVERIYDISTVLDYKAAWTGTLAFAGQIYCDFAGYSTCAVGAALCLGFYLHDNFNSPYAAVGFSDFWRRWHISLSTWLRDYLYVPLGGNRHGVLTTYRNLALTMLLGGLWHGANWRFVAWGMLHGLYLSLERALHSILPPLPILKRWYFQLALAGCTFALVNISWVFFRAPSFERAWSILASMLFLQEASVEHYFLSRAEILVIAGLVLALCACHWLSRNRNLAEIAAAVPWWVRGSVLGVMLFLIFSAPAVDHAFIYFQF